MSSPAIRVVGVPDPAMLERAREIVARHLTPTPLVSTATLGADGVRLKLETLQPTGAFKVRGALAALAGATGPVVTASAGNHGLGVAWAGARLGVVARIVVPETASPAKLAGLEALGADVVRHGDGYDAAEAHAFELVARDGGRYVSAYNDTAVIAGQATLGAELESLAEAPLHVVVPIGGGGLLSGIALWASAHPSVRVTGVEAAASPQMSAAVAAGGRVVPVAIAETIADGLAGNLEDGSVTARIVADHVDTIVSVTEPQLHDAIRVLLTGAGVVAEGAGAAAAAGLLAGHVVPRDGETTVVVVSGRNIAAQRLAAVLA